MLTYRKGITTQRQIKITTQSSDTLVIDFCELDNHKFVSKYYIILDSAELATVQITRLITAWIDGDDYAMKHTNLMISEDDMN
jgi:hypothetical protein